MEYIRLLLITFFLQFFPELVKEGHVYVLETPLFRVRNRKETSIVILMKKNKKQWIKLEKIQKLLDSRD